MTQQCPQCQRMNLENARFCKGCGAELKRECAACGKMVSPDAKYCSHCGAPVLAVPRQSWIERLSPEKRLGLFVACRSLGITLIILAFALVVLTPPPRMFDEFILLAVGASLMVLAHILQSGHKGKPPDDDLPPYPDPPPPDGLERLFPDEIPLVTAIGKPESSPASDESEKARLN